MSTLPLSGLRAFEAASRCGSFRHAAAELHLTPSAVSHAVRRLEESLGVALFERRGRAMRLTAAGAALTAHTVRGFAELQRGVTHVSAAGPLELRLHCAPSFAAQWLVPRLPRLLDRHRQLEIRLDADANYSRFAADEYDADLIYGLPRVSGLSVTPLCEERVVPLCTPGLAASVRRPQDLAGLSLIQSVSKTIGWADWFAANGIAGVHPRGPRFDRSFLALSAAAAGLGVALESTLLAERELASGRLAEPLAGRSQACRYVGHRLVHRASAGELPALALFRTWLLGEVEGPSGPVSG